MIFPVWVKPVCIGIICFVLVAGTAYGIKRIYDKGEKAGASSVTTEVQRKTIDEVDKARRSKEQTDEKTVHTPYDDRVDGLR